MIVYRHYNQEQLNDQYNTRIQVPEYSTYFDRWESLSRDTEKNNTILKDISFGKDPEECLDIFPSKYHRSKTLIYIHGGYWHLLDKAMFHFLAGHFLKYGVTTVLINYPLAPRYSISQIVESCRKALRWVHENIILYNGDPAKLFVMGHSAGGHLASMMIVDETAKFIRAMISLSGLFRLEPIMLSYLNDFIDMNRENATRNSPVFLNPVTNCPVLLVTGTDESDEFKAQSEELYRSWKEMNGFTDYIQVSGKNHYSILDAVAEKESTLCAAILRLMDIDQ